MAQPSHGGSGDDRRISPARGSFPRPGRLVGCVAGIGWLLTADDFELDASSLEVSGIQYTDSAAVSAVEAGSRTALVFQNRSWSYAELDLAVAHADERTSMGKPLREHQAVSQSLGEMATRTEAARLLVYAAASAYDRGERVRKASAMAKLFATETAQQVVDAAIQIHGARALERGHPLEHLYREVRAPRIYEGTSEIQRIVIARELYSHS